MESNFAFALVLYHYALWLVNKIRATFSTNGNPNQNQSCIGRTRFPALGARYMDLLWILIGSLCCLHLLRLARVVTLVLVLRHSHSHLTTSHTLSFFKNLWTYQSKKGTVGRHLWSKISSDPIGPLYSFYLLPSIGSYVNEAEGALERGHNFQLHSHASALSDLIVNWSRLIWYCYYT